MTSRHLPPVDQVLALPSEWSIVIPDEFTDANGHMNIARYMDCHSDGGWAYFGRFGMSEDLARDGGATAFDMEHHITYHREVLTGHEVSVHVRLIDRTDKALHSVQFLVNRTTSELANMHEAIAVSVDLRTRVVAPFPEQAALLLDAQLEQDRRLPWAPPLSGSMALRSRTR